MCPISRSFSVVLVKKVKEERWKKPLGFGETVSVYSGMELEVMGKRIEIKIANGATEDPAETRRRHQDVTGWYE